MRSKRREVVIELTSLLDVVMIIIFAVLIENSKMTKGSQQDLAVAQQQVEQMQNQMTEMQAEMDKMSNELSAAQGMLAEGDTAELLEQLQYAQSLNDSYSYMENVVVVINVNLENKYNNTKRCLTYGQGVDDGDYKSPDVDKDDDETWNLEMNNFKLYLNTTISNIIEQDKSKDEADRRRIYITLSADYNRVYNSDYNDLLTAIQTQIDRDTTGLVQLQRISLGN